MCNKSFCLNCGKDVYCSISSEPTEITVRGVTFKYNEMTAYCKECGERIYVSEINDDNVILRKEAYCKAVQLNKEYEELIEKWNSLGFTTLVKYDGDKIIVL